MRGALTGPPHRRGLRVRTDGRLSRRCRAAGKAPHRAADRPRRGRRSGIHALYRRGGWETATGRRTPRRRRVTRADATQRHRRWRTAALYGRGTGRRRRRQRGGQRPRRGQGKRGRGRTAVNFLLLHGRCGLQGDGWPKRRFLGPYDRQGRAGRRDRALYGRLLSRCRRQRWPAARVDDRLCRRSGRRGQGRAQPRTPRGRSGTRRLPGPGRHARSRRAQPRTPGTGPAPLHRARLRRLGGRGCGRRRARSRRGNGPPLHGRRGGRTGRRRTQARTTQAGPAGPAPLDRRHGGRTGRRRAQARTSGAGAAPLHCGRLRTLGGRGHGRRRGRGRSRIGHCRSGRRSRRGRTRRQRTRPLHRRRLRRLGRLRGRSRVGHRRSNRPPLNGRRSR